MQNSFATRVSRAISQFFFIVFKDAEDAHKAAGLVLRFVGLPLIRDAVSIYTEVHEPILHTRVFGLDFKNPVGMGGGFDKAGLLAKGLEALEFGFVEVGTVTQHAQSGNPRPRIFRYEADGAVINRMGFNNAGADAFVARLARTYMDIPLGVSLGKSKITELADAPSDYLYSFKLLYEFGDYFVINVSSPNTPGLRALQDRDALIGVVSALNAYRDAQRVRKPLLVKVAPDLTDSALDEVLNVCAEYRLEGIIATNTTLGREGLTYPTEEAGGMSGKLLRKRATEVIRYIHKRAPQLPIVGVGGIFTAEDAYEKVRAGASLLQLYTGFIYGGPLTPSIIAAGLAKLLKRDGFTCLADAVGVDA